MLTGENGILKQAARAKEETEKAQANEVGILDSYEDLIKGTSGGQWNEEKKVNSPRLVQGMTEVSFILPNGESKGEVVKKGEEGFDENNWYDYKTSKWANTVTEDGSYWVWIPRYAYKLDEASQTIDIKFLIGKTDQYYDDEGKLKTAKRAKSKEEIIDTSIDYYVHPAFTNESSIDYANGGWDEELEGIWVAKFEAGYATGNNSTVVKASNVNYSQNEVFGQTAETGTGTEGWISARNYLDGVYGSTTTAIKYPTFQPITYSMNYISISDCYDISKALTNSGNIYGLSSSSTDSHLMKNSEWGAVAYLSWSEYGTNKIEPFVNNICVYSNITSVYAVTGLTTGATNEATKRTEATDITNINSRIGNTPNNGIYAWDQLTGEKASSTLNMYGVYDLSGGVHEITAGYINNEKGYLETYGSSVVAGGDTSTKYVTVYPHDANKDKNDLEENNTNKNAASDANYGVNTKIFGDAIRETSTSGTGTNSWNGDNSYFPGLSSPFTNRGGSYWNDKSITGLFAFNRFKGNSDYGNGFRPVLVAL